MNEELQNNISDNREQENQKNHSQNHDHGNCQDLKNLWENIISKSGLPQDRVSLWLSSCTPLKIDENNALVIDTQNPFVKEYVAQNFLKELDNGAVKNNLNSVKLTSSTPEKSVQLDLAFDDQPQSEKKPDSLALAKIHKSSNSVKANTKFANLNPGYTFETFVVGKSNRLAHAASLAVAEMPGKAYNPLFIWGGVGLGKTHLMHAICHHALSSSNSKSSNLKVQYLGTEKFLNEFVNAIATSKMREFRERYRSVDILLIDDIQFLGNKDQSQEEFYNTFNTLRDFNKQVVICSDRPPSELRGIEDRLISRFAWGLVADIQPPDFETRVAILQKKAMLKDYALPNEVAGFLARHIPSNIRELEGALNRVMVSSELKKEPADIDHVKLWLSDVLKFEQPKLQISIEDIKVTVAEYLNVSYDDIDGSGRSTELALARQIAMYLSRNMTDINLRQIARAFHKKDHTTVLHAEKKIAGLLEHDSKIKFIVSEVKDKLNRLYYW